MKPISKTSFYLHCERIDGLDLAIVASYLTDLLAFSKIVPFSQLEKYIEERKMKTEVSKNNNAKYKHCTNKNLTRRLDGTPLHYMRKPSATRLIPL